MEFGAIPILGGVQWRCFVLLVIMRLFRLAQLFPQSPNFKLLARHRNRTLVPGGNTLRPLWPSFRLGGMRKAESWTLSRPCAARSSIATTEALLVYPPSDRHYGG